MASWDERKREPSPQPTALPAAGDRAARAAHDPARRRAPTPTRTAPRAAVPARRAA